VHLNQIYASGARLNQLGPLNASGQLITRVIAPKILLHGVVGPAIVGAVFGQYYKDVYQKWLQNVPGAEKLMKQLIPDGWIDPQGAYHYIFSVDPRDLTSDWKASYIRLPQSAEETDAATILGPAIEDIIHGQFSRSVKDVGKGIAQSTLALPDPFLEYGTNMIAAATGFTPMDWFRGRPIINKQQMDEGNLVNNELSVMKDFLGRKFNSIVPSNFYDTKDGFISNVTEGKIPSVTNIPMLGPVIRSLHGVQNYGLHEVDQQSHEDALQTEATVKNGAGDATKELLKNWSHLQSNVLAHGGVKSLNPNERNEYSYLSSWKAREYKQVLGELLNSYQKGDNEAMKYWYNHLEQDAESIHRQLYPEKQSQE
jgi:hypothetical protein